MPENPTCSCKAANHTNRPSLWTKQAGALALLILACSSDPSYPTSLTGSVGGSRAPGSSGSPRSVSGGSGTLSTANGGTWPRSIGSTTEVLFPDGSGGQASSGGTTATTEATGGDASHAAGGNSSDSATGGAGDTGGGESGGAAPTGRSDASGGVAVATGTTESTGGTDASGGVAVATGTTESTGGTDASGGSHHVSGEADPAGGTNASGGVANGATESTGGTDASGGSRHASGGADPAGGTNASGGITDANGGTTSAGGTSMTGEGGEDSGGRTGIGREPPVFVIEPTLEPNDNDSAPLAAMLTVETNVSVTGTVFISGGNESWSVSLDDAPVHHQPLLGFKPDTDYEITVTVDAGDTNISAPPLTWHSPALPNDFPHLVFVQSDSTRMAPGMTMFDVIIERYLVVVDDMGDVRWFYRAPRSNSRYRLLANGNIVCVSNGGPYLTEIDWFGNAINTWYAANSGSRPGTIPVAVNNFHHNMEEMPNGNFLVLSQERRVISNYPTSAYDPMAPTANTSVVGDQVVEFSRNGEIVHRYSLFDIIDPTRIGHDSEVGNDWTHSNAVIYDADSDAYLVSMRHQDAVIKIRRKTGELVWILGNHANWREPWRSKLLTPLGDDFEWQYHQHAIELIPGGIGLYDNGNHRAPAYQDPTPPYYSRVVRFSIDEDAMRVGQFWAYRPHVGDASLFSYAMSDADLLTNGNVLITSGTLTSQRPQPGWAQIVEVTDRGETVFELDVLDSPLDATTFDADRIADIRYMTGSHAN